MTRTVDNAQSILAAPPELMQGIIQRAMASMMEGDNPPSAERLEEVVGALTTALQHNLAAFVAVDAIMGRRLRAALRERQAYEQRLRIHQLAITRASDLLSAGRIDEARAELGMTREEVAHAP